MAVGWSYDTLGVSYRGPEKRPARVVRQATVTGEAVSVLTCDRDSGGKEGSLFWEGEMHGW